MKAQPTTRQLIEMLYERLPELFDRTQSQGFIVDLNSASGFTFTVPQGTFVGDVAMIKWLVEHRSKDYWEHKASEHHTNSRTD